MKSLFFIPCALFLLSACGKGEQLPPEKNTSKYQTPATLTQNTSGFTFFLQELSLVPTASAPQGRWTFPTLYPLTSELLLVQHNSPELQLLNSIYDSTGKRLYQTNNVINFYQADTGRPLVVERAVDNFQIYLPSVSSANELVKSSEKSFTCRYGFQVSRSIETQIHQISCSDRENEIRFFATPSAILTEAEYEASDLQQNRKKSWIAVKESNVTLLRGHHQKYHDFRSAFTEVSSTAVLYNEATGHTVLTLDEDERRGTISRGLKISRGKTDALVIPLEPIQPALNLTHNISYLRFGTKASDRLILREYVNSGIQVGGKQKFISTTGDLAKPIVLTEQDLLVRFCRQAIAEGKDKKYPAAYENCHTKNYSAMAVDTNVDKFNETFLKVDIVSVVEALGRTFEYRGAIVLDQTLEPVRTYEMIDVLGELKFLSQGPEMYAVNRTHLTRFTQEGSLKDNADFCSFIPGCDPFQHKTIVSFGPKGQFIFKQWLAKDGKDDAPELIYVMKLVEN